MAKKKVTVKKFTKKPSEKTAGKMQKKVSAKIKKALELKKPEEVPTPTKSIEFYENGTKWKCTNPAIHIEVQALLKHLSVIAHSTSNIIESLVGGSAKLTVNVTLTEKK